MPFIGCVEGVKLLYSLPCTVSLAVGMEYSYYREEVLTTLPVYDATCRAWREWDERCLHLKWCHCLPCLCPFCVESRWEGEELYALPACIMRSACIWSGGIAGHVFVPFLVERGQEGKALCALPMCIVCCTSAWSVVIVWLSASPQCHCFLVLCLSLCQSFSFLWALA